MPGIVDLAIGVLDAADERTLAQRRDALQRPGSGEVAVVRQDVGSAHGRKDVVQQDSAADVRPLPHSVLQRVEETNGAHQVRGEVSHEETALAECLHDEPEVQLLQVPQTTVDQLRRTARCSGRQVALLDHPDPQAAAGRIERTAGPRHSGADDHHIERIIVEIVECPSASFRAELRAVCRFHGRSLFLPRGSE